MTDTKPSISQLVLQVLAQPSWSTLLLALMVCVGSAQAQDHADLQEALTEEARMAFWVGDFPAMERLHVAARQEDAGPLRPYVRMRQVRKGFNNVLDGYKGSTDLYFAELQALTGEWAAQYPTSSFAHVLHASSLVARGWAFRGKGYANTVPPGAWADFVKYNKLALKYLQDHAELTLKDGQAFRDLITIGRALGWSADRIWGIAQQGLQVSPLDDSFYFLALWPHLPKWGGNAKNVDNFIKEVVARTSTEQGQIWYAKLYVEAAQEQFQHKLFEETYADWPRMKQGFEELIKREPSSSQLNSFAYFSCLANDKSTLIAQLEAIGTEKLVLASWGSNGARSFEACKRLANDL